MATGSLRCAQWARTVELSPIGTAGTYNGFLIIDLPLPWPSDIGDLPELAPVVQSLKGTGVRLQARVSDGGRAVLYRRGQTEWFAGYQRVGEAEAHDAAKLLSEPTVPTAAGEADVLICSHGRRDACCGSMGTVLASDLANSATDLAGRVRFGRTSHLGGHRFAPTALVLPEGTAWGYLDADVMRQIVTHSGSIDDVLARYRGCCGLGPPGVQALERQALAAVGWEWFDWRRRGRMDGATAVLEARSPTGEEYVWRAAVSAGRTLPVPDCGKSLAEAKKSETEVVVSSVLRSGPEDGPSASS